MNKLHTIKITNKNELLPNAEVGDVLRVGADTMHAQISGGAAIALSDTHEPGMYIDMPEDEYHADQSLSASKFKDMNVSMLQFWDKHVNPDAAPFGSSPYMEFGKAMETRLLEPKRWAEEYVEGITLPDNVIDTVTQLKAWLVEHDVEFKKSLPKPDLIDAIMEVDPKAPIKEVLLENFARQNAGKNILHPDTMAQIDKMMQVIEDHEEGICFEGSGLNQVSVFWEEDGVPMKARLDRIDLPADDEARVVDLKTFSNSKRMPITRLADSLTGADYLMQSFTNLRGLSVVRDGLMSGEMCLHGCEPDNEQVMDLVNRNSCGFSFFYIESSRPHNVAVKSIAEDDYWTLIQRKYEDYLDDYRACLEIYLDGEEWRLEEVGTPLTSDQVPFYVFGKTEEIAASETEISGE